MKKITTAVLAATLLIFGAGSLVSAHDHVEEATGKMNVGQMKQNHEDMSIHEFKKMYQGHHGTLGAAPSKNFKHHHGGMDN
ncbi:hypothetical protein CR194_19020 [Salipaludibacillus keqinensis]|uniref:DUF2680 domain-containing protein n=1 Tax=Salipaludibacillus keqinensis TaxID=2045207 RepID=A0A323T9B6_9BACI|nr:hypothetical protein [Salipaludibacillus keqinensis]PYZ91716.1 hypothetical protein CR194_19020 [Salipaludibacillus keqinensis]